MLQLLLQGVGGREVRLDGAAALLSGAALVLRVVRRRSLLLHLLLGLLVSALHAARAPAEAHALRGCVHLVGLCTFSAATVVLAGRNTCSAVSAPSHRGGSSCECECETLAQPVRVALLLG